MNVDSILVADFAQVTAGKLTVVGVFNRITASTFPAQHQLLFVTLVIHAHPDEAGPHHLEIRLIDASRDELARIEADFTIGAEAQPIEGLPLRAVIAPGVFGVVFPSPGPYAFEVFIDDTYAAAASLAVTLPAEG